MLRNITSLFVLLLSLSAFAEPDRSRYFIDMGGGGPPPSAPSGGGYGHGGGYVPAAPDNGTQPGSGRGYGYGYQPRRPTQEEIEAERRRQEAAAEEARRAAEAERRRVLVQTAVADVQQIINRQHGVSRQIDAANLMLQALETERQRVLREMADSFTDPDAANYIFVSPQGEFRTDLENINTGLLNANPTEARGIAAKGLGFRAVHQADRANGHNQVHANYYRRIGQELLGIAIGLNPVVSFGRGAYEILTGYDLIDGHQLSPQEQVVSAVMMIGGGPIRTGIRMLRLARNLTPSQERINQAIRNTETVVLPRRFEPNRIQQESDPVCIAMRERVETTRIVYRKGSIQTGRQEVNQSHYWLDENPMNIRNFEEMYGTTAQGPTANDFIVRGRIREGAPFVTRFSGRSPDGRNAGGAPEVVIQNPNDVIVEWVHIYDGTLRRMIQRP